MRQQGADIQSARRVPIVCLSKADRKRRAAVQSCDRLRVVSVAPSAATACSIGSGSVNCKNGIGIEPARANARVCNEGEPVEWRRLDDDLVSNGVACAGKRL